MAQLDIATTIEAGVIAQIVLGSRTANAYVGGGAVSADFIKNRPDVAKRYVTAWGKALQFIEASPDEARKHLLGNTVTPESVVGIVPLLLHTAVGKLSAQDKVNFQSYVDYAVKTGAIAEGIDMTKFLYAN
jgi:NitT/TauT family transport system substrate-binding protein